MKSQSQYNDKCKLQNDKLLINGISYSLDNLHRLPPDLAPYQAAQKEDSETIAFHGLLSPWSNFHSSLFVLDGKRFKTAEHWIQYPKAIYFRDSHTANEIINSDIPQEAKKLGHQVAAFDMHQCKDNGYDLCIKGVQAKFEQNVNLPGMLKATEPKLLVEESNNQTWGTGIPLRDGNALNKDKWQSPGWLSEI